MACWEWRFPPLNPEHARQEVCHQFEASLVPGVKSCLETNNMNKKKGKFPLVKSAKHYRRSESLKEASDMAQGGACLIYRKPFPRVVEG